MDFYTRYEPEPPLIVEQKDKLYDNNIYVFDTEVSSVFKINGEWKGFDYSLYPKDYEEVEKAGILYLWGFSVNEKTYYGRTLKQFVALLNDISDPNITKIVYVHNLAYDFQFLMNIIEDFKVFARKPHHPIKAYTATFNIEFRCSYYLTNSSLSALANFYKLPVKKLVGDLDYRLVRHSKTYISPKEFEYLNNDLLVVYYYIKNVMLPVYKTVVNIPLTQTGRVRREVKNLFIRNKQYLNKLKTLQPPDYKTFRFLRQAFAGGWTHANMFWSGTIIDNVLSYDRASSYPSVMIMEKYPMTPFEPTNTPVDLLDFSQEAALIDVTFYNFRTVTCNTYMSFSKAIDFANVQIDNGRIISADIVRFRITDVDYSIIQKCYTYDSKKVHECLISTKDYLPTEFIDYILKLYKDKTALKGIDEYFAQYQRSKEYINSMYGMTVTNTIQDECCLDGTEWITTILTPKDIDNLLKENIEKKNVLSYAWGVWVTAYARQELWKIILEIDSNVVYCDTDSIKFVMEENKRAFDRYNKDYMHRLKTRGIDFDLLAPKDSKGKRHPLGVFEQEKTADKFKTMGAKKYCCQYGNELKITVSGVPKGGVKQLKSIEEFKEGFIFGYNPDENFIPEPKDEKVLSFYLDNQQANGKIEVVDYNGLQGYCEDDFGICLMPTTYRLDMELTYEDVIEIIHSQLGGRPTAIEEGLSLDDCSRILKMLIRFNKNEEVR